MHAPPRTVIQSRSLSHHQEIGACQLFLWETRITWRNSQVRATSGTDSIPPGPATRHTINGCPLSSRGAGHTDHHYHRPSANRKTPRRPTPGPATINGGFQQPCSKARITSIHLLARARSGTDSIPPGRTGRRTQEFPIYFYFLLT